MRNEVDGEQPEDAIQGQRHAQGDEQPEKNPIPFDAESDHGQEGVIDPADGDTKIPFRTSHFLGMNDQGGDKSGWGKERKMLDAPPVLMGIDQHNDRSDGPSAEPQPEPGNK